MANILSCPHIHLKMDHSHNKIMEPFFRSNVLPVGIVGEGRMHWWSTFILIFLWLSSPPNTLDFDDMNWMYSECMINGVHLSFETVLGKVGDCACIPKTVLTSQFGQGPLKEIFLGSVSGYLLINYLQTYHRQESFGLLINFLQGSLINLEMIF